VKPEKPPEKKKPAKKLPAPPKVGDKNTAPTTTAAEDDTKQGQRRVNLIWETTQATLAVLVTASTLYVAGKLALSERGSEGAFLLLSNAFFAIVSTYLTRTNHQKTGGVGSDDTGR
jgi:hypothetical protein